MKTQRIKSLSGVPLAWLRVRAFARSERASVAIEFGILALPFITLVVAIMETAIIFFSGQILESALNDTVRLIRTGQAQATSYDLAAFRTRVCDHTYGLFDCSQIRLRVRTVDTFAAVDLSPPIDPGTGQWQIVEGFSGGVGRSIVVAEAHYKWDRLIELPGLNFSNAPDGTLLMSATRVWRNEPF